MKDIEDEDNEKEMIDELAKLLLRVKRQPHLRDQIDFNHVIDCMCIDETEVNVDGIKGLKNGEGRDIYRNCSYSAYDRNEYDSDDDDSNFDSKDITLRTIKRTVRKDKNHQSGFGESEDETLQQSSPQPASTSSSILDIFRSHTALQ